MKKLLSIVLYVVLLLTIIPLGTISASAATSGMTGDCTWTLDGKVLTISGSGKMGRIEGDKPWGELIEKVIIKEGVTNITGEAFYDCVLLKEIVIPSSVKETGGYAFQGCTSIKSVYISNLESWCAIDFARLSGTPLWYGANLYINNKLAENIIVPKSITEIKDDTFHGCESLKTLTLHNDITRIGESAFDGCINLTHINLPNSITKIDDYAFADSGLVNLEVPKSITNIGEHAFAGCNSLKSITLPNSISTIEESLFSGSDSIKQIVLPESILCIKKWAFYNCGSVKIYIGKSVEIIAPDAFGWGSQTAIEVYYAGSKKEWETIFEPADLDTTPRIYYNSKELPCEIHYYGNFAKKDITNHERTCTVCGYVETAVHSWDGGKVTKEVTCKETGVKTITCTKCNETKTETIAKTTAHTYGNGTVTKEPTETATGIKTKTCSVCGDKVEETIPKKEPEKTSSVTLSSKPIASSEITSSKEESSETISSEEMSSKVTTSEEVPSEKVSSEITSTEEVSSEVNNTDTEINGKDENGSGWIILLSGGIVIIGAGALVIFIILKKKIV